MSRLTLRFGSSAEESGFVRTRTSTIVARAKLLAATAVLLAGTSVLLQAFVMPYYKTIPTESGRMNYRVQMAATASTTALGILSLAVLRSPRFLRHISTAALEVAITLMLCLAMCVTVLSTPAYVDKLQGNNRHRHYPSCKASDAANLLLIDGVVAVANIGLPIRWHILLALQATGVLLYAGVVFGLGSVEGDVALYNLNLLTGLILVSSCGKRSGELLERQAFKQVIDERKRRCHAEFRLSQVEEADAGRPGGEPMAENSSLPTTTATGRIFDAMLEEVADVRDGLSKIAMIVEAEHWRIQASHLRPLPGRPLGKGGFGVVHRAAFCGMAVAVKTPHGGRIGENAAGRLPELCNELHVLRRLKHPNVVQVLGVVIEPEMAKIALVLELVHGQALQEFLRGKALPGLSGGGVDASTRHRLMSGIILAVVYMHSRSVVHGDLKPDNIMVEVAASDGKMRPRLLDFGLSRVLSQNARALGRSLKWTAPEGMWIGQALRCSADVYSAGLLLAFVAAGAQPMAGLTSRSFRRSLVCGTPPLPTWPQGCLFEPALRPMVERCLVADAAARPTAAEIHEVLVAMPAALGLEDGGDTYPLPGPGTEEEAPHAPEEEGPEEESPGTSEVLAAPEEPAEESPDNLEAQETPASELPPRPPQRAIPTKVESMVLGMRRAVSRWNVPLREHCCCPYHKDMQAARDIALGLFSLPCNPAGVAGTEGRQCPHCGILGMGTAASECDFCSQRLAVLQL